MAAWWASRTSLHMPNYGMETLRQEKERNLFFCSFLPAEGGSGCLCTGRP